MKLTIPIEHFDAMSLQPLETPPLRVSRPVAACSRCRNAKIKCDGKLPACTSCEKNGRAAECTSTNDQFARGKERSYVSTLETRIDRLQEKIRDAQARKPSVVSLHDDETPMPSRRPSEQIQPSQRRPVHQDEVPTPTTGRRQKRREVSAIDDLVSDFGFLSVNATARDFHGFTQAMSYARLILWSCSKDELPKGTLKALPSRNDGMALVQFYLGNVFALLPAFNEATLWTAFENVYSKGSRNASSLDYWMVRMVFAIANASMSRRSGDEHYHESISHVCAALDYAEHVLHPGNISGVQGLLLLAEYAMLAPHHFDSWQLIGAASRAMTDLGYHQDPQRGAQMDRSMLELRRKIFYCIYVLDRSTSLVQTRAFSFSDASSNVKVPFGKQPGKTSMSSEIAMSPPQQDFVPSYEQASDLVELRKIQSAWYTELFQTSRETWNEPYPELWRVCEGMRKWFSGISPSTPPHMRQFFELDLLYSYVYVLSPSSRVPRIHQYAQKLIFEYCIRYTDLMLHLIDDPGYTAPLTFYDAMRVYMTGRQFIDVLSHSVDLLLSGAVPSPPEVKPSATQAPSLPVAPLPPGETTQRFNTYRAVNCIKQTMDCMGRFGVRWGYMSWSQRYEHESKAMLDNLEQRLHVIDETNRARRASMWGSNGSIPSSNGTTAYYSPPQSMSQGPTRYKQGPPQMPPKQSSYGDAGVPQQSSPPPFYYQQQPAIQPGQQYAVQQGPAYGQVQPQYQQAQRAAQPSSFSNHSYRPPSQPTAPGQQFAAWSGYGLSSGPDTLDEENASLIRTSTNQSSQSLISPRASRGSIQQPAPHPPSDYVATFEPLRRSQVSRPSRVHFSVDENETVAPDQQRQFSQPSGMRVQPTAGFATEPDFDTSMPPPPLPPARRRPPPPPTPPRRTSMQEASNDLMQTIYPTALPVPPQGIAREPSPRLFTPPRMRETKGKEKALDIYAPVPPAGEVVGRCRWDPGFGYVCEICSRICPRPDQHRASVNGTTCIDLSGQLIPLRDEVQDMVAQDPERAIAEASAIRASQGGWVWMEPGQDLAMWNDEAGLGRPGGSMEVPNFTTASQIQQWAGGAGFGWQQGLSDQGQQQRQQRQQQQQQEPSGGTGYDGAGAGMFF